MNRIQNKLAFFFVLGMLLLCVADVASACPTCKDGLAEDQKNMVEGYFWSIIFMMSMPFLIFTGLGGYFYLLVRKAKAQQQATNVEKPAVAPAVDTSLPHVATES